MKNIEKIFLIRSKHGLLPLIYDEIENDYYLLGVTAIEDKLQDQLSEMSDQLTLTSQEMLETANDEQTPVLSQEISYEDLLKLQHEQLALIPELPPDIAASLPEELRGLVAESLAQGMIKLAQEMYEAKIHIDR